MAMTCMKGCFTSYVIKKFNLKQQWNTTMHLLEWPKSEIRITSHVGEDMKQQELSYTASGECKYCNHFGILSYRTEHTLTVWSSKCAPWNLPKGAEIIHPHKNLHTDVCSNFIHNCQNLRANKMPLSRWKNK